MTNETFDQWSISGHKWGKERRSPLSSMSLSEISKIIHQFVMPVRGRWRLQTHFSHLAMETIPMKLLAVRFPLAILLQTRYHVCKIISAILK